jgi:hypothetical protein
MSEESAGTALADTPAYRTAWQKACFIFEGAECFVKEVRRNIPIQDDPHCRASLPGFPSSLQMLVAIGIKFIAKALAEWETERDAALDVLRSVQDECRKRISHFTVGAFGAVFATPEGEEEETADAQFGESKRLDNSLCDVSEGIDWFRSVFLDLVKRWRWPVDGPDLPDFWPGSQNNVFIYCSELRALDEAISLMRRVCGETGGTGGTPAGDPNVEQATQETGNAGPAEQGNRLKPGSRAMAAAVQLKKEGKPVSLNSACKLARVDRDNLRRNHPQVVQAIRQLV